MSYVRWSSKVVADCPECGNEGWVALVPGFPDLLTWRGVTEGGDREPFPHCCTSCWYIFYDVGGWLQLYHAGSHVCHGPNGMTLDSVRFYDAEDAREWTPPEWCRHRAVALECVAEWIEEQESEP